MDEITVNRCPMCGGRILPAMLKCTQKTTSGYIESYVCDCGARFSVELSVENDE